MTPEILQAWEKFIVNITCEESTTKDYLESCLEFRWQLGDYLRVQGLKGSSEDLINLFTKLHTNYAIPASIQLLNKLDSINIALVDYNKLLFKVDNEQIALLHTDLGQSGSLLNQITLIMAENLYPNPGGGWRNRIKEPVAEDIVAVKGFFNARLENLHKIMKELQQINAAIKKGALNSKSLFLTLWSDKNKSALACSLLAQNESFRFSCFKTYNKYILQLIEKEQNKTNGMENINPRFIAFFAKQQSIHLLEKSKNCFFENNSNIAMYAHGVQEINKASTIRKIGDSLNAISKQYSPSALMILISLIKEFLGLDPRPQTVKKINETQEVLSYLSKDSGIDTPYESSLLPP